jgi:alpha-2-macroglobulin
MQRGLARLLRVHPRRSLAACGALLLGAVAAYAGWRWYQALPRPVAYEVTVTAPQRTCLECEPPGRPNPLHLTFAGSVAPLAEAGKVIDPARAGITLAPQMPGQWRWHDDRTLVFTPASEWPLGQSYELKLAQRGFTAPQVRLTRYALTFTAPQFTAGIGANEFYQDPQIPSAKKIVTTLDFSAPVDVATVPQHISLKLYARVDDTHEAEQPPPTFTLSYDKLHLHAYVHSSQLTVLPKGGRVAIAVDKGLRAARGGNHTTTALAASVAVPGLYSLAVSDMALTIARDERDTPSQVLIISTTHAVTEPEITARVRAWLLPVKHPDADRQAEWERYRHATPYQWAASLVTPTVLTQAEALTVAYVANEREQVELHSFRLKVEPGRQVYVRIDKGLRSFGGYLLADSAARVLTMPQYPQEVHIAHDGALLALSGPRKLLLQTRDVAALRVEVARLLPNQLQHLVTQSGGDFAHPRFERYGFSDADITQRHEEIVPLAALPPGTSNYQSLDLDPYLSRSAGGGQGVFLLRVEAYDPVRKKPVAQGGDDRATVDTRLVVITDLGLLAKRAVDGSQDVFVQSITSGEPLASVTVQVIGRNGEPVLSRPTDATGHVHFPDLHAYKEEREPVLYLARQGADSSFLPIKGHVEALDLSRFDVGGVSNRAEQAALSAYLFSDRGIYRPGDEIRAAAIIRAQDWRALPAGVPLRIQLTDPRGIAIKNDLVRLSAGGFEEIRYRTREVAAVGTYTLNVYLIAAGQRESLIGSLTLRVQEFLPDRLRIATHFSSERTDGWVSPEQLQARVKLENLFGTPAAGRRLRASMRLSPAAIGFARYRDYEFRDPQAAREGFAEELTEQKTADDGQAQFDLDLSRFTKATYSVALSVEGYEADAGRAVSGAATQLVSSLPFLVGWKADGPLDFIARKAPRSVQLLAIDAQLAPSAAAGLKLKRSERRYVSVLLRQDSGVYKYESRPKEIPLAEEALALPAAGATLALDTATPGNFSYVVSDADGQVYARIDYTVAGAANLSRSMDKNAELQIVLDRHDYAPGDTISMQIQAPYTGAGLITIERDHVYAWQWFKTTTTSSVQTIKVPDDLEGNGYVSVSFVRDPAAEEVHTSPLSYGVQPFSIALDARRNAVTLHAPALVKPGADLAISYRTTQPARIVVFAVDEGILQVARYRTPDPLGQFFRKRSLDVSTRQILDLILPGFRSAMLSAPGGDQRTVLGANLNPFKRRTDKPVAFWSGIVAADTAANTLHFTVPDYFNGSVRIMAVAVNDASIGTAETTALVRGDFVLSPNTPLTVAPGDGFEVSLGVANNVADSGNAAVVTLTLQPSAHFELLGPAQQRLPVAALHEAAARWRVRARDVLGSGSLEFRATLAGASAQIEATIAVRPATAYMTSLAAGSFTGTAQVPVPRILWPQFRTLEASVSMLPLALAHGLTAYLDHYPYSCTEQLVSQAMPAVALAQRPEFGALKAHQGATLASVIEELRARQNEDGSFRYWAGGVESVDFVSVYALHVLLEARERGAPVPADLLASGEGFLSRMARRDADNLQAERTGAYAIYLLARQGVVVANEAAALQQRLNSRYPKEWHSDIVAAYLAGAYQLMQQESLANRSIAGVAFGQSRNLDRWHGALADDAMLLYILARHFPQRLPRLPADVLENIVAHVQRGEYDSLSAATTILALDAYATASSAPAAPHLSITATLADRSTQPLSLPAGLFPRVTLAAQTRALEFASDGALRGFYLVNQSGFDRDPNTQPLRQGLEITREFLDASGQPLHSVRLGDTVTVHLRFRAIGAPVDDAVLVDLLPGGFDVVVPPSASAEPPLLAATEREGDSEADGAGHGYPCPWLVTRPDNFPDFADLREDRVVLYGRATTQVQEFSYRIKASNAGSFTVPAAFGESMYDPQVRARSAAAHLRIERP